MKFFVKKIIIWLLTKEAQLILRRHKPRIVAITGSVGKTSTKEAVALALSTHFSVRKSEKSYNSEIGVPLTIIGSNTGWNNPIAWFSALCRGLAELLSKNYPSWLILETGIDRPGDMEKLTSWIKPNVVILTRLPILPVHVEFFPTPQALIEEKIKLVAALHESGQLVLNSDDEAILKLKESVRVKTTSYGFLYGADVKAAHYEITYKNAEPSGFNLKISVSGNTLPIQISGCVGKQHAYSILAGFAVGNALGIPLTDLAAALSRYKALPGRMQLLPGLKQTLIIDDSYNSSPVAAEEALNSLKEIANKERRIAALGDMRELGSYSAQAHKDIGAHAADSTDVLVTVGLEARNIAVGALEAGMPENKIFQFEDSGEAGVFMQNYITAGDIILIKGSQAVRMERAVQEIMAEPTRAGELLVRQEQEWMRR